MLCVDCKTADVDIVVSVQLISSLFIASSSMFLHVSAGVRDEDADQTAGAAERSLEGGSRHG